MENITDKTNVLEKIEAFHEGVSNAIQLNDQKTAVKLIKNCLPMLEAVIAEIKSLIGGNYHVKN